MTPRELFENIDDLCKVYGVKKVKTTIISFFEILEKKNKMTDFEKCREDLMRWGVSFEVGEWYKDNGEVEMKYIYTFCDYIKFDVNGNYVDTE